MQTNSHIIYIRGTSANDPILSLTFASLPSAAGRTGAANGTVKKTKQGTLNQINPKAHQVVTDATGQL